MNRSIECKEHNFTGTVTEQTVHLTSIGIIEFNCSVTPEPPKPYSEICWETMLGQVGSNTVISCYLHEVHLYHALHTTILFLIVILG